MSSVSALLGAATRLASAGRRGALAPSVDITGGAAGVPADTSVIVGGDDPALATDPVLAAWFARIVGAVSTPTFDVAAAGRLGRAPVWPILSEGGGHLDTAMLEGAIPAGTAWIAALRPDRFFAQAATRLEARGDARGADWAARLRSPTGNVALLGRLVSTAAITLSVGDPSAIRLRVKCPDEAAGRQAALALHAWRVRRGLPDDPGGAVFRASDLVRDGARVELVLPGELNTVTRLFGRG
jgi:hypothetical protein